nr:cache domain-containing protein [Acuticoccus mangrovi]
MPQARQFALRLEVDKVRALTESAADYAQRLEERARNGEISREEAQSLFADAVRSMWYDDHSEYFFASDLDGNMVAHGANPALEGRNLWELEDKKGFKLFQALSAAAQKGGGAVTYWWPQAGSEDPVPKVSYVSPIPEWGIFVGTGIYMNRLDAEFSTLLWVAIGLSAAGVALVILFNWLIARDISRPAQDLADKVHRLSMGEVVEESEFGRRGDAIGEIARAVSELRTMMAERNSLLESQAAADEKLKLERARATEEMASALDAEVSQGIETMQKEVAHMTERAEGLRQIAERMSHHAGSTFSACEAGNASVQVVAAAAEELSASSQEISRQVHDTAATSRSAVDAAEGASRSMNTLAEASRSIGEVTKLINAIAEQTNLLALNATIEAARAGEAGRGFTIVAQEVKGLAEQTARATADIETQIRAMQGETQQSVDAINGIVRTVSQLSANTQTMAAALEEQDAAIREIAASIVTASQSTSLVSDNMNRIRTDVDATNEAAETVWGSSAELKRSTSGVRSNIATFLDNLRHSNDAEPLARSGT